jgi:NAD(P)-dependent dehydrogenase (short-subunit alcohol dehydrogenase family)
MPERFEDKVVLVTGGGSGIGKAAAIAFARERAKVVVVDRDEASAQRAAADIKNRGGVASSFGADVSDPASCEAMVAHSLEAFGALHIAFNNAGIAGPRLENFTDISIGQWNEVVGVNLSGVFYSMKAEIPAMRRHRGSAIVNTASAASYLAAPAVASYIASKHGVAGLTKAAALDLIGDGIRVNAVCPGYTETGMMAGLAGADEALRQAFLSQAPIRRVADPSEIAEVVLFLASEAASYVVGCVMLADGGLTVP